MSPIPAGSTSTRTVPTRPGAEPDAPQGGPPVPAPRAVPEPLPRRTRGLAGVPAAVGAVSASDPDGHLLDPVDETTLNRVLSGLREI